jgi:hypothetical protein
MAAPPSIDVSGWLEEQLAQIAESGRLAVGSSVAVAA